MVTRASVLAACVVAGIAAALAPAAAAPDAPVFALLANGSMQRLARLDPDTMQPLKTSAVRTAGLVPAALSPDRTRLQAGARIMDVETLAVEADFRKRFANVLFASAWPRPDRVLLAGYVRLPTGIAIATIDPVADRMVDMRRIPAVAVASARTAQGLALLLAPPDRIARARLALVEPGRVRIVALPVSVATGREFRRSGIGKQQIPGLAVDPATGRAYVFPAAGGGVEVDVASGRVRSHALSTRRLAKGLEGPRRAARWLGRGLVALTGTDEHISTNGGTVDSEMTPAGLTIVDVRTWRSRLVTRDATDATYVGGLLFARNVARPETPIRGYDLSGRLRVTPTGVDSHDWLQAAGARAFVANRLLDVPSGRVLATVPASPRVVIVQTDGPQFPF